MCVYILFHHIHSTTNALVIQVIHIKKHSVISRKEIPQTHYILHLLNLSCTSYSLLQTSKFRKCPPILTPTPTVHIVINVTKISPENQKCEK